MAPVVSLLIDHPPNLHGAILFASFLQFVSYKCINLLKLILANYKTSCVVSVINVEQTSDVFYYLLEISG